MRSFRVHIFVSFFYVFFVGVVPAVAGLSDADPQSADLYKRLGVSKNATAAEIKQNFKALAFKFHPDRNGGTNDATKTFQRLGEARDILLNPEERAQYDALDSGDSVFSSPSRGSSGQVQSDEALRQELRDIAARDAEIADYVMQVMMADLGEFDTNFRVLPKPPRLYYTDLPIALKLIETGNSRLMINVAFSVLWVPGWKNRVEMLKKIIAADNSKVNDIIAGSLLHPHLINKEGLEIMKVLIDRGHFAEVARSLSLGGFLHSKKSVEAGGTRWTTWIDEAEGMEALEYMLARASAEDKKVIDFMLFDGPGSKWTAKLRAKKPFRKLVYISCDNLQSVGFGVKKLRAEKAVPLLCGEILKPKKP